MRDLSSRAWLGWALFVAALSCFLNLGGFGLASMEPMVADSGRHMLLEGDWATPHLYGELFTFKPPLAPWLSAASQHLWTRPGPLELRLPFALLGFGVLMALFALVSREHGARCGALVTVGIAGSVQFAEKTRIAQYDAPLAAGLGLAVVAAVLNLSSERPTLKLWLATYAGLMLGFLAKGSPALLLFAPGLLLAACLSGAASRLFRWQHMLACLVFGLGTAGYLGWALDTVGPAAFLQPVRELLDRGGSWTWETLARLPTKPLVIWACFLPWSVCLLLWSRFQSSATLEAQRTARAAAGFLISGVLLFLLSASREARYYLPLVASFSLVAAVVLDSLWDHEIGTPVFRLSQVLHGLSALLVLGFCLSRGAEQLWILLLVALGSSLVAFRPVARLEGRQLAFVLNATSLLCVVAVALQYVPERSKRRDLSGLASEISQHLGEEDEVWLFGPADCAGRAGTLLHELRRSERTVAHRSRLPRGSAILLVEPQSLLLPERLDYQVVERVSHPRANFTLIRTASRQPPGVLAPEPTLGEFVGDFCRGRYQDPPVLKPHQEVNYRLPAVPDPIAVPSVPRSLAVRLEPAAGD